MTKEKSLQLVARKSEGDDLISLQKAFERGMKFITKKPTDDKLYRHFYMSITIDRNGENSEIKIAEGGRYEDNPEFCNLMQERGQKLIDSIRSEEFVRLFIDHTLRWDY